MKKVLLSLFFGATVLAAQAQLSLTPNPVVVDTVIPSSVEAIAHSTVKNMLPVVRTFRWERTIIQMTDGWTNAVCDKNQCYLPGVNSEEFVLGPNEEGLIDVHVYPNGISGSAIVEVKITDVNNANNTVTGTYYFNTAPVGVEDVKWQSLAVYPNPTEGFFTVSPNEAAAQVWVLDLLGRPLRQFNFEANQMYDIQDLAKGAYIVRLLDRSGETMITRLLNKI